MFQFFKNLKQTKKESTLVYFLYIYAISCSYFPQSPTVKIPHGKKKKKIPGLPHLLGRQGKYTVTVITQPRLRLLGSPRGLEERVQGERARWGWGQAWGQEAQEGRGAAGAQGRPPPNVSQWHSDYFELKLLKKTVNPRGTLQLSLMSP